MLSTRIELRGEELFCADTGDGGIPTIRRLTPETLARLRAGPRNATSRCARPVPRLCSTSDATSSRFSRPSPTQALAGWVPPLPQCAGLSGENQA
jgi:hypothetical protein